jgi:hypothetical protein
MAGDDKAPIVLSSVRRARPSREEVDAQVAEVEAMMLAGEWLAGRSHRACAERWGVSVDVVEQRAREAGRSIRRNVDREAVTAAMIASLDTIVGLAVAEKRPRDRDLRAAVAALDLRARLLGLVTTKVDVRQDLKGLSDEELQARIDAEIAAKAERESGGDR